MGCPVYTGEGDDRPVSNVLSSNNALNREQKFELLMTRWQQSTLRLCYLYLCDRTLAEDALQETFLKVYKTMDSFRGECSEKTWIMRIAMNTCYDINHSHWFRLINRKVTPDMLPERAEPASEDDDKLIAALIRLPLKLREVILLYYYQGMKVEEIAGSLGIAQSSVSGRLKRGREKLKALLDGRELDE